MLRTRILWVVSLWPLLVGADNEVRFQGKPVDQWARELRSADVEARRETMSSMALVSPGGDAIVPILGSALKDSDPQVRRLAVNALGTQSTRFKEAFPFLIDALGSEDREVRLGAIQGLAPQDTIAGGDQPIPMPCAAFLALVRALETEPDAVLRAQAAAVLGTIRSNDMGGHQADCFRAAEQPLIRALQDSQPQVRLSAVSSLTLMRSKAAVPALLDRAASDSHEDVRLTAAFAVAEIQPTPGKTIPLLARAFTSRNSEMRRRAVELLGLSLFLISDARYADTASADREAALSLLLSALKDPDPRVRSRAADTFIYPSAPARQAVPALIEALKDPATDVMAARVLARIGPDAIVAVPALAEVLRNERTRADAVKTLISLGPNAVSDAASRLGEDLRSIDKSEYTAGIVDALVALGPEASEAAVPPLLERLAQPDPRWKRAAAESLGKLGPAAASAVSALISELEDKDRWVRAEVAGSLGRIGPAASSASPALVRARDDRDETVRYRATASLLQILGNDEKAVPYLIQSLREGDSETRSMAAYALPRFPLASAAVVPALAEALKDADLRVRQAAMSGLSGMGKDAVPALPALVACLRSRLCAGQPAASAIGEIGRLTRLPVPELVEAIKDADAETRYFAISALRRVRNKESAVPNLVLALSDEDQKVRVAAALCLTELGEKLRPAMLVLVQAIDRPGACVKQEWDYPDSVRAISQMGPEVRGFAAALVGLLGHCDIGVRRMAAAGLGSCARDADTVVPVLIRSMHDTDPGVREASASSLGRFGAAARAATRDLLDALFEANPSVRAAAATALGQLGRGSHRVIESLARAMKDPDYPVRAAAADALGALGPAAQSEHELLVSTALEVSSGVVGSRAASALWKVDPRGGVVAPPLVRALSNKATFLVAARALDLVGPSADRAVPSLVEALKDPSQDVCAVAARALGKIGLNAKSAIPALIAALDSEPSRLAAVVALGSLGAAAAPAIPKLVTLTTTAKDETLRERANYTIRSTGPESVRAVPPLLMALSEPHGGGFAFQALFALDANIPGVAALFIQALDDPRPGVRHQAAVLANRIESPKPDAIPTLVRMATDADWDVRYSAIQALGRIGPAARAAVPTLVEAQADRFEHIRKAASDALAKIRGTREAPEVH